LTGLLSKGAALVIVVGALRAAVRTALAAVAGLAVVEAARVAAVVLVVVLTGRLPARSSWWGVTIVDGSSGGSSSACDVQLSACQKASPVDV
jgi:hypothetical protein